MKFYGSLPEWRALLSARSIRGRWFEQPNGCHMLRLPSGANVHWASGSKTVWINGAPAACIKLQPTINALLTEAFNDPNDDGDGYEDDDLDLDDADD